MDASIENIELIDINGRSIINNKIANTTETQINISDIAQGVYMLRIVSDRGTLVKKIVKE
jgi:hypothetical protein